MAGSPIVYIAFVVTGSGVTKGTAVITFVVRARLGQPVASVAMTETTPDPARTILAVMLFVVDVPDMKDGKVHVYVVFATEVTE